MCALRSQCYWPKSNKWKYLERFEIRGDLTFFFLSSLAANSFLILLSLQSLWWQKIFPEVCGRIRTTGNDNTVLLAALKGSSCFLLLHTTEWIVLLVKTLSFLSQRLCLWRPRSWPPGVPGLVAGWWNGSFFPATSTWMQPMKPYHI